MSDRGRMVLIIALVALVAGGGGFYFLKIYQPAKALEAAQDEINAWETRYQAARACLLGKSPASAKTSEALAIREMTPDPWERGKCTPLISKLSRGVANETGIDAIEKAWAEHDKVAQKAALAFATHVGSSTTIVDDPLPAALDALDASRISLRHIAKLPSGEHTGKTLPTVKIVPLPGAADRNTPLVLDTVPSAHGTVVFIDAKQTSTQLVLTAGAEPKSAPVAAGAIRAVPDLSWAASAGMDDVSAGALDANGEITAPTKLKTGSRSTVAAVIGTLADGVLVYGSFTELGIARAKAGTITAQKPVKIVVARAGIDVDGRAAVVWSASETSHFGRVISPAVDEPPVELPGRITDAPCLTKDRAWGHDEMNAIAFGGGKPVFRKPVNGARLQGCTAEAAVYRDSAEPRLLFVCSDDCRRAAIPSGAPVASAITIVNGKLVTIAAHGGVLGVWPEHGAPTFYSFPEMARPVFASEWPAMALTDGKVIDMIARGSKSYVLVRIPAS